MSLYVRNHRYMIQYVCSENGITMEVKGVMTQMRGSREKWGKVCMQLGDGLEMNCKMNAQKWIAFN